MKRYHFPDGRTLGHGTGFDLGDYKYPPNWLELATPEDLSSRSITAEDVVIAEPPVSQVKASLKTQVDNDAEQARLKFITPGSGMAMTYQEKHAQAQAVQDLGEEAANALSGAEAAHQFPTLAASVGIEAPTLYASAELVIERYELFAAVSGLIESARLGGKKAISDASDAASARAAYEAITWPQP